MFFRKSRKIKKLEIENEILMTHYENVFAFVYDKDLNDKLKVEFVKASIFDEDNISF